MNLITTIFAAVLLCTACQPSDSSKTNEIPKKRPIALGVAYDITESVTEWPDMDSVSIQKLGELTAKRGGTIALGHISEESFRPLFKQKFIEGSVKIDGSLTQRAKRNQEWMKLKAESDKTLSSFSEKAMKRMLLPRNRSTSDIAGSIERFSLFFGESRFKECERIFIIMSDGKDNVSKQIKTIPDAHVWVIGWRIEDAKKVFGNQVRKFESMDGALSELEGL